MQREMIVILATGMAESCKCEDLLRFPIIVQLALHGCKPQIFIFDFAQFTLMFIRF